MVVGVGVGVGGGWRRLDVGCGRWGYDRPVPSGSPLLGDVLQFQLPGAEGDLHVW